MPSREFCPICNIRAAPHPGGLHQCPCCHTVFTTTVRATAVYRQELLAFEVGESSDSSVALKDEEPPGGEPDGSSFVRDLAGHDGGASTFTHKVTHEASYNASC